MIRNVLQLWFLSGVLLCAACQNQTTATDNTTDVKEASTAPVQEEDIEKKLQEMGITLYELPVPPASFVRATRTGNLVYLSGHGPTLPDGSNVTGKVGKEIDIKQGQEAARYTGITLLSALKGEIGDLNKVTRIVKVLGMVNSTTDFKEHPQIINGFSDLMVEVFGERGKHARSAVGLGSLPGNIPVEIEMIVEIRE